MKSLLPCSSMWPLSQGKWSLVGIRWKWSPALLTSACPPPAPGADYLRVIGKCAPCWWWICRLRAVPVQSKLVDLVQVGRPVQREDELLANGWHWWRDTRWFAELPTSQQRSSVDSVPTDAEHQNAVSSMTLGRSYPLLLTMKAVWAWGGPLDPS